MFEVGDTVELKMPEDWTNSKLLKKAFVEEITKGFILRSDAYDANKFPKYKGKFKVVLGFHRCDSPSYYGNMLVFTSRMVLTEKFDAELENALTITEGVEMGTWIEAR